MGTLDIASPYQDIMSSEPIFLIQNEMMIQRVLRSTSCSVSLLFQVWFSRFDALKLTDTSSSAFVVLICTSDKETR